MTVSTGGVATNEPSAGVSPVSVRATSNRTDHGNRVVLLLACRSNQGNSYLFRQYRANRYKRKCRRPILVSNHHVAIGQQRIIAVVGCVIADNTPADVIGSAIDVIAEKVDRRISLVNAGGGVIRNQKLCF